MQQIRPSAATRRQIWLSFGIGGLLFSLICALSSLYPAREIDRFFLIGMRFAAVFFPEGIHSDAGLTFLAVGLFTDLLMLSLPVFIAMRLISARRNPASQSD
jgi:hypothetical protein